MEHLHMKSRSSNFPDDCDMKKQTGVQLRIIKKQQKFKIFDRNKAEV